MNKHFSTYSIALVGLFGALCFIGATISIPIPIGLASAKVHLGNVFMIIGALLLGGMRGGLAAGIGMSLSDVFSGAFMVYAPGTLFVKFFAALVCGMIVYSKNNKADNTKLNIIGVVVGIFVNIVLSSINSFAVTMIVNEGEFLPSLMSAFGNFGVGLINGLIAGAVSLTLGVALVKISKKTPMFNKIHN